MTVSPLAKRLNIKRGSESSRAANSYLTVTIAGREMKINIVNATKAFEPRLDLITSIQISFKNVNRGRKYCMKQSDSNQK